jgi:hypothetical protein
MAGATVGAEAIETGLGMAGIMCCVQGWAWQRSRAVFRDGHGRGHVLCSGMGMAEIMCCVRGWTWQRSCAVIGDGHDRFSEAVFRDANASV